MTLEILEFCKLLLIPCTYLGAIVCVGRLSRRLRFIKQRDFALFVSLFQRSLQVLLVILMITNVLNQVGVDVTNFIASLGITSFAAGLVLKDIASNIFAGFSLVLYTPFKVGTLIEIDQIRGTIIKIDLRYTSIQSEDTKEVVLFPNNVVLNSKIKIFQESLKG